MLSITPNGITELCFLFSNVVSDILSLCSFETLNPFCHRQQVINIATSGIAIYAENLQPYEVSISQFTLVCWLIQETAGGLFY
jgi:hypothetical protein